MKIFFLRKIKDSFFVSKIWGRGTRFGLEIIWDRVVLWLSKSRIKDFVGLFFGNGDQGWLKRSNLGFFRIWFRKYSFF